MTSVVLDASALLAVLRDEPGSRLVEPHLASASMSAVNLTEVPSKLVDSGMPEEAAWSAVSGLSLAIVDHDAGQARRAARLRTDTRRRGLSLGDRACLALAETLGLPAITADRHWAQPGLSIDIRPIR